MSFKRRMQDVSSADELRELMAELVVHGSRNWTWDAALHFIPSHLWEELAHYFDDGGRLRVPSGRSPSSSAGGPVGARSLSELVATFHLRLADARAARSVPTLAPPPESDEQAGTKVSAPGAMLVEDLSDDHGVPDADADADAAPRFVCPICELPCAGEPVSYRGTEMCVACADLVRVT